MQKLNNIVMRGILITDCSRSTAERGCRVGGDGLVHHQGSRPTLTVRAANSAIRVDDDVGEALRRAH
jgi:hypothetical protein